MSSVKWRQFCFSLTVVQPWRLCNSNVWVLNPYSAFWLKRSCCGSLVIASAFYIYSLFVNCVEVSLTEGTTRCIVDKIVFHTNNVNMYMWYKTVYYKLYLTTLTLLLHLTSKLFKEQPHSHHSDVIMGTTASQITSLTIVYWTLYSVADQRKHQSSASLAFERGIHRGPVNSPHKWPVTRKMFPFDDVIKPLLDTLIALKLAYI